MKVKQKKRKYVTVPIQTPVAGVTAGGSEMGDRAASAARLSGQSVFSRFGIEQLQMKIEIAVYRFTEIEVIFIILFMIVTIASRHWKIAA